MIDLAATDLNRLADTEEMVLATSAATTTLDLQLFEARRRIVWAAAWLGFAADRGDATGSDLAAATAWLKRAERALDAEARQ